MDIEPGFPHAIKSTLTLAAAFQQLAKCRLSSVVHVFRENMTSHHVDFALEYQPAFTSMVAHFPAPETCSQPANSPNGTSCANCPQKQHLRPVDTGRFGAHLDDVDDDESRRLVPGASKSEETTDTGVNVTGRCPDFVIDW